MSVKGLIYKEINAAKFKTAVGSLILIVMAVSIPLMYDFVIKMLQTTPLPGFVTEQAARMTDYNYFVWSQWFGKNYFQVGVVLAVIFGSGLISSEISRKTVHFLLTRPLSRQRIFTVKYLISLFSLLAVFLISTMVLYITVAANGHNMPIVKLLQNMLFSMAGFSLVYTVAVYFSTIFDQTMKAFLVSIFLVIVSSIAGFSSSLKSLSIYYQMSGTGIFDNKGFPYVPFLVIVALTALIFKLGLNRFSKTDY